MSLKIDAGFSEKEGLWVVRPEGEIDISNAHILKERLAAAFGERQAGIRIDMGGTTYLDSTGLGAIIGAYGRLKEKGCILSLANPRDNVKKLLNVTNLDRVLMEE